MSRNCVAAADVSAILASATHGGSSASSPGLPAIDQHSAFRVLLRIVHPPNHKLARGDRATGQSRVDPPNKATASRSPARLAAEGVMRRLDSSEPLRGDFSF